jgi:hypothetical protein
MKTGTREAYYAAAETASFNSQPFSLDGLIGIQIRQVGTLLGSLKLQTTNWPNPHISTPHRGLAPVWVDEPSVSITAWAGADASEMIHVGNLGAKWGRIVYTDTSGTGLVLILVHGTGSV